MPLNLQRNYPIIPHPKSCLLHNSLLTTYLLYNRIMAPTKKTPPAMTKVAIRKLVKDSVKAAIATERAAIATKATTAPKATRAAEVARTAEAARAAEIARTAETTRADEAV